MKFVHSGDWHMGKIVNEYSMLENQTKFLDDLIDILKREEVDALVIAGDVYDRSVPPAAAVELLDNYVDKIVNGLKIPILAISGNHDGGERLSYGSSIMRNSGYHMAGILKREIKMVTIKDTDFYLIPYFDPAVARKVFEDDNIKSHEDGMKKVIDIINVDRDKSRKSVIVAHGYVTSVNFDKTKSRKEIIEDIDVIEVDSERPLTMGGTEFISRKVFEGFDYVALGHLHEAKKVSKDDETIRYSGSPLKYSISEKNHNNSISIVEIDDNGVKVKLERIKALRDIRVLKGQIDELTSKEFTKNEKLDDYIHFILTDDGELYEPMAKLKSIYKNPLSLERDYKRTLESKDINIKMAEMKKSKSELFKDFYENVTKAELSQERFDIMSEIIEEVEGKE
ncbi:MAG: exonuclease SbcCD subunit D [Sarcina sp.]